MMRLMYLFQDWSGKEEEESVPCLLIYLMTILLTIREEINCHIFDELKDLIIDGIIEIKYLPYSNF